MSILIGNSASGDPYWSNVVSLLHFEGTNGSTTFLDQISSNVWTPNGTCSISTTSFRFGSSSGNFPINTLSPIQTPNSTPLLMGTGDFTIEGWFNPIGTPSAGSGFWYVKGINTAGDLMLGVAPTYVMMRVAGSTNISAALTISTWTHIAWVRHSGTTTIYVGGISATSTTTSFNNNDTSTLAIGSGATPGFASGSFSYGGYLDEVRITKGIARYTSNFTPSAKPFPNY